MSLGAVVVVAGGAGFSLADGVGRALFGYLGDLFGRRRVMLVSYFFGFILQMLVLMSGLLHLAAGFAIFAVLSGLLSGVGFALTATIVPDYWGTNHNAQNYATVYSFKTVGGIVAGGVAALVITGGFAEAQGQPHWLRGFILGSGLLAIGFLILLLRVTRPTVEQMQKARADAQAADQRRRERKGLPPEPRDDEPADASAVDTATGDTSLRP
jgi:MFS family permease